MSDIQQGTDEWFKERLGKLTASRFHEAIAKTKSGWGASRANYMADLIAERLTGVTVEKYTNATMQWGIDTEPEAAAAYAFYVNAEVTEVGFVPHPYIEMAGASPDRLVGKHGLAEIKCPLTATHIESLLGDPIDGKYITQMQFQMACTGRKWCDWVSYDPRMPQHMRLFVKRVPRDDARILELETMAREFLAELAAKVAALRKQYEEAA
jgi:putative phage-type endonuclease